MAASWRFGGSDEVKSHDVCNNSSRLINQLAINNAVSTSL